MRMRTGWGIGVGVSVAFICGQGFAWTDLDGGDHGGSNWVIASGTYIASNHYNLGTVSIASGATVRVKEWDGVKYGRVEINAQNINILGDLNASGAGYKGGSGGSGGNGTVAAGTPGGSGVVGSTGNGPSGGVGGGSGAGGYESANPNVTRQGGGGGWGGAGGYAVSGGQGDLSTDEAVLMGSGGGGGGGGGAGWNLEGTSSGGGGGGGGNPGGGMIRLISANTIVVRGTILAKGAVATRGNGTAGQIQMTPGLGGSGGSPDGVGTSSGGAGAPSILGHCYSSGAGGSGGAGAGGGVLIKAPSVDLTGATIANLGGGNFPANGGSLKVFYNDYQGGTFTNTGRTYLKQMMPPEPGTVFEF